MPSEETQPDSPQSITVPQASHLLLSFTHFLTVSIHNILFYRSLYPPATFLTTRAYNLAVHQSRHPAVCTWIRDAVDAVRAQLVLGSVSRIAIVVHHTSTATAAAKAASPNVRVLERWMIDVAQFPAFRGYKEPRGNRRDEEDDGTGAPPEVLVAAAGGGGGEEAEVGGVDELPPAVSKGVGRVNWTDVDEAFGGAVRRMAFAADKLSPLPEGCSFTVAVELRDEGEAPIGYPQHWIPSEANLQTRSKTRPAPGKDVGGARTAPIRSVEAGPLFFECWVEEGQAKDEVSGSNTSSS